MPNIIAQGKFVVKNITNNLLNKANERKIEPNEA